MKQLILLTGANGLVGSYILKMLLDQGYRVRVLLRAGSDRSSIQSSLSQCEIVEGDITGYLPNECMEGVHTVVHAAAVVSFDPKDRELLTRTNVEGTKQLLHAAAAAKVVRWIQISSVAALGRIPSRLLMDEDVAWEDSTGNSHYAISKYLADLEVARAAAEGLSTVTLCPSVVLGSGRRGISSTRLIEYVANRNQWVTIGTVNIVGVTDVAKVVVLLLEYPLVEGRFILSASSHTYQQLFSKLAEAMHLPAPNKVLKQWQMHIAAPIAGLWAALTGSRPLLTAETVAASTSQYRYNGSRITTAIPFAYEPLEKTIEQAVRSFVDK
jgi:nucleoside-diphosphate-sugar epimerase